MKVLQRKYKLDGTSVEITESVVTVNPADYDWNKCENQPPDIRIGFRLERDGKVEIPENPQ